MNRRTVCGVSAISGTRTIALLAALHHFADALKIDFSLAAAGHAQKQIDRESAVRDSRQHRVVDLLLVFIQRDFSLVTRGWQNILSQSGEIDFRRDRDQAEARELPHRRRGCPGFPGETDQLDRRPRLQLQQPGENRSALGRAGLFKKLLYLFPAPAARRTTCEYPSPTFFRTAAGNIVSSTLPSGEQ